MSKLVVNRERWSTLVEFVAHWYQDELSPSAEVVPALEGVGPVALREWFLLVGNRIESDFLSFPDPKLFYRWPQLPRVTRGPLHQPDVARGLLPIIRCGGHGGWGVSIHDTSDDPPVHCLEEDGETSEPFPGVLSALLTNAVVWETVSGFTDQDAVGPLGALRSGVRRLDCTDLGASVEEFLRNPRFQLVPSWTLEGERFLADAERNTLIKDDGDLAVITRTESAWDQLQEPVQQHRATEEEEQTQERARRDEEKAKELAELGSVPTTGPELVKALEDIEGQLLRFQKIFLEDFRRQVQSGSGAPSSLVLKAAQILKERRP